LFIGASDYTTINVVDFGSQKLLVYVVSPENGFIHTARYFGGDPERANNFVVELQGKRVSLPRGEVASSLVAALEMAGAFQKQRQPKKLWGLF
jgi:hypothetical protein